MMRRILLPPDHEDHMPPEGKPPLTVAEATLIRWWIDQGASFEQQVAEAEMTPIVQQIFDGLELPERKTGVSDPAHPGRPLRHLPQPDQTQG